MARNKFKLRPRSAVAVFDWETGATVVAPLCRTRRQKRHANFSMGGGESVVGWSR